MHTSETSTFFPTMKQPPGGWSVETIFVARPYPRGSFNNYADQIQTNLDNLTPM